MANNKKSFERWNKTSFSAFGERGCSLSKIIGKNIIHPPNNPSKMGIPRPKPKSPKDPRPHRQGGDQCLSPEEARSQSQHSKDNWEDRRSNSQGSGKPKGKTLPPGHLDWRRENTSRNESSCLFQASGQTYPTDASRMGSPSNPQVLLAGAKRGLSNSSLLESYGSSQASEQTYSTDPSRKCLTSSPQVRLAGAKKGLSKSSLLENLHTIILTFF